MIPQNVFDKIIIIIIPIAIKNNANPITLFMIPSPNTFLGILYAVYYLFDSASSKISTTSSSVIFFSLRDPKRSSTSGTISRIFVIVS